MRNYKPITDSLAKALMVGTGNIKQTKSTGYNDYAKAQTEAYRLANEKQAGMEFLANETGLTPDQLRLAVDSYGNPLEEAQGPVMPGMEQPMKTPEFWTDDVQDKYRGAKRFLAMNDMSGGGSNNATQLSSLWETLQDHALRGQAIDAYNAGDLPKANAMVSLGDGNTYTPYSQNANGSVLDQATGAVNQNTPMANAWIADKAEVSSGKGNGIFDDDFRSLFNDKEVTGQYGGTEFVTNTKKLDRFVRDWKASGNPDYWDFYRNWKYATMRFNPQTGQLEQI